MYYNDPNFSSYSAYASWAQARGNTPLSESRIASEVSAARSAGISDAMQQEFLGSNPGDWGRLDTAFNTSFATAVVYAEPNAGGTSGQVAPSSLAQMSLVGAVTGGGQLAVPLPIGAPSGGGFVGPQSVGVMGAPSGGFVGPTGVAGIPSSWIWILVLAVAGYVLYQNS